MVADRVLLLGMLVLLTPAVAVAETATRKTLAECVEIALKQQPALHAAGALVQAARERVWQTAAAYLPQVGANYSAGRRLVSSTATGTEVGTFAPGVVGKRSSTFNVFGTGVTMSQVLFDFGQNLALIHAAQANAASVAADAQTEHDTVVFNVDQAYFALLAAYRLRDVAEETVTQNQQHLDVAQGRYDVGLAARFDVTTAQVQLAGAELNQVTARNNVALARETLRNVLGLSGPLDFDIVDELEQPTARIDDEAMLDLAYAHRPELRSIAEKRRATTEQIAALEKDYLPKVTGSGGYAWQGNDYPLRDNWNIGAAVNLSIFNGGLTTAQIGEARANLKNLEFTEEGLRQNITLEVRQAVLNVHQTDESIRVADKGLQQAQENVELAEGRYATGVGAIIELTDAQASLTRAKAVRVQALVDHHTALAALERATAWPLGSGPAGGT